jgi:DNA-binding transcriptional ArsR family regulator
MTRIDGYKALADPTRRQILKLLREGDLPAGAIAEQFAMSWPSVSRHLAVLSSAGLVRATRHGRQLVYSLTTSVLADIVTELADMARVNQADTVRVERPDAAATRGAGVNRRRLLTEGTNE